MKDITRIVALGASNLTRGFNTVVRAARTAWGPQVEILAALGHGRSYGASSRVAVRTLPGILESGIWRALESLPPAAARALVTDIGNDLMYGFPVEQILLWVEEALRRLRQTTQDIIVTNLPLENIQRLSRREYLIFRSILFPRCRSSLVEVLQGVERINMALERLSEKWGAKLFRLSPSWYGIDPIHIRRRLWASAWRDILGAASTPGAENGSWLEGWKLYFMPPELRWIFGIEQYTPQKGVTLRAGGRVWLF